VWNDWSLVLMARARAALLPGAETARMFGAEYERYTHRVRRWL
jgi:hypothetical protein